MVSDIVIIGLLMAAVLWQAVNLANLEWRLTRAELALELLQELTEERGYTVEIDRRGPVGVKLVDAEGMAWSRDVW